MTVAHYAADDAAGYPQDERTNARANSNPVETATGGNRDGLGLERGDGHAGRGWNDAPIT